MDDAAAVRAIYAPIVESTPISFELEPPSVDEVRARIAKTLPERPWLVDETDGAIRGYAYASAHRERAAYRWAVDVSVYVGADHRRSGVARRLYGALFAILEAQGFVAAHAGVVLPNAASVRLHASLGFRPIGVYPGVGFKMGKWHDVAWFTRDLAPRVDVPAEVVPLSALDVPSLLG